MVCWDEALGCYITACDDEQDDDVELYLPPFLAHKHANCIRPLQFDERLMLTINKERASDPPTG
eukprot:5834617-Prorocentrum_lima.AAC.1